ncbi:MAG: Holliday junction resolvase RuvX [Saprospiraceae bacterium]|nr:Holliday junction resolvase RuvX [Saprospiraceae bacterium]MBK9220900.1 Holliday junction resolvase RuvX [Saprospiraceae bacterium]MBK9722255.1 Holliday junction resolvase RuvX [Saprospiraceae bacterium]
MARILSIDFGLKRCGIAVTDPLQIIVNGLTTVETKDLETFIQMYCAENPVEKIIIGYPFQKDHAENSITPNIILFKERMAAKLNEMEFQYYDEKKSSVEASRILVQAGVRKKQRQDKALIDKMSAVVILQRYLGHI